MGKIDEEINALDVCGWAPIHYAVASDCFEFVQLLINHGADVRILSKSMKTPLMLAKQYEHESIAQLLIANGA